MIAQHMRPWSRNIFEKYHKVWLDVAYLNPCFLDLQVAIYIFNEKRITSLDFMETKSIRSQTMKY